MTPQSPFRLGTTTTRTARAGTGRELARFLDRALNTYLGIRQARTQERLVGAQTEQAEQQTRLLELEHEAKRYQLEQTRELSALNRRVMEARADYEEARAKLETLKAEEYDSPKARALRKRAAELENAFLRVNETLQAARIEELKRKDRIIKMTDLLFNALGTDWRKLPQADREIIFRDFPHLKELLERETPDLGVAKPVSFLPPPKPEAVTEVFPELRRPEFVAPTKETLGEILEGAAPTAPEEDRTVTQQQLRAVADTADSTLHEAIYGNSKEGLPMGDFPSALAEQYTTVTPSPLTRSEILGAFESDRGMETALSKLYAKKQFGAEHPLTLLLQNFNKLRVAIGEADPAVKIAIEQDPTGLAFRVAEQAALMAYHSDTPPEMMSPYDAKAYLWDAKTGEDLKWLFSAENTGPLRRWNVLQADITTSPDGSVALGQKDRYIGSILQDAIEEARPGQGTVLFDAGEFYTLEEVVRYINHGLQLDVTKGLVAEGDNVSTLLQILEWYFEPEISGLKEAEKEKRELERKLEREQPTWAPRTLP